MNCSALRRGSLALFVGALMGCGDTTEPRVPAVLEIAAGDGQSATVGALVPVPPAVRVLTSDGKPVPNTPVTFSVAGGGGTLGSTSASTDRTGTAQATGWTMGSVAGENALSAVAGTLLPVTFRVTAVADLPTGLQVVRQPAPATVSGAPLATQPVVQLIDRYGNASFQAGVTVEATVLESAAVIANATAVTREDGRATFTSLSLTGPTGPYTIEFRSSGLSSTRAAGAVTVGAGICGDAGAGALPLEFALGQVLRVSASDPTAPTCLAFELTRAQGHQYLLLFENMPANGAYTEGVFNELPRSPNAFTFAVRGTPSVVAGRAEPSAAFRQLAFPDRNAEPVAPEWDFGDGAIREGSVGPLPVGETEPMLLRKGVALSLQSAQADPQVGDTVSVYLEGIDRLGIPSGQQRVVIRHLSDALIFAEDVRLDSLPRDGSTPDAPVYNTPLTSAVMDSIALEYAAFSRAQGDLLFEGRHNNSVESRSPDKRVLAVHTLMYANNIWGYTYSSSHYFAYDYWVGQTNGSTRLNAQHPQRLADVLFMHEIAHMRHYGMLERAGRTGQRGNQWLVEGFARFSERLPIANRLLGAVSPSRTANLVLPFYTVLGNTYYFDDVPTYLQAGASMFGGYGASAFVFDYFADQVALRGGQPLPALRDFLINAGSPALLDATVTRWLPDVASFGELFTRSRIALYTDDYPGGTALPPWTQYHQYQLRASRPPSNLAASDPRNAWLKVQPGSLFSIQPLDLPPGTARGLLIDGTTATASARISIEASRVPNGLISITRIR